MNATLVLLRGEQQQLNLLRRLSLDERRHVPHPCLHNRTPESFWMERMQQREGESSGGSSSRRVGLQLPSSSVSAVLRSRSGLHRCCSQA